MGEYQTKKVSNKKSIKLKNRIKLKLYEIKNSMKLIKQHKVRIVKNSKNLFTSKKFAKIITISELTSLKFKKYQARYIFKAQFTHNIFAHNIEIKRCYNKKIKRHFSSNIFFQCELKIFIFGQLCSTDVNGH